MAGAATGAMMAFLTCPVEQVKLHLRQLDPARATLSASFKHLVSDATPALSLGLTPLRC